MTADPRRLDPLAGRWRTEGRTVGDHPPAEVTGTDTYEWLGGGHFLVHRVGVRFGADQVDTIEIIGVDGDTFRATAYEGTGAVGTMTVQVADGGVFTFAADDTRSTLVVAPDGAAMTGTWERRGGTGWAPWLEMRFTRLV